MPLSGSHGSFYAILPPPSSYSTTCVFLLTHISMEPRAFLLPPFLLRGLQVSCVDWWLRINAQQDALRIQVTVQMDVRGGSESAGQQYWSLGLLIKQFYKKNLHELYHLFFCINKNILCVFGFSVCLFLYFSHLSLYLENETYNFYLN